MSKKSAGVRGVSRPKKSGGFSLPMPDVPERGVRGERLVGENKLLRARLRKAELEWEDMAARVGPLEQRCEALETVIDEAYRSLSAGRHPDEAKEYLRAALADPDGEAK